MPRASERPAAPVPRLALTRREAATSLGMSLNHFERKVQPELKVILCGQLVLIPMGEIERWVARHAHPLIDLPVPRPLGDAGTRPGAGRRRARRAGEAA